jgi:hypothetical protein
MSWFVIISGFGLFMWNLILILSGQPDYYDNAALSVCLVTSGLTGLTTKLSIKWELLAAGLIFLVLTVWFMRG